MHAIHIQLKKSNKLQCMNKCELQKHTRKSTQLTLITYEI